MIKGITQIDSVNSESKIKEQIDISEYKETELYETPELERLLSENKNEVALILVGGVNYYTGQYLPLKKIN